MPNYVGSGPGGSIDPLVDDWTPTEGEQVRQDLQDHEDGLADHETRIDALEISSGGDVDGPASATDNAIARFDGTTGKLLQNSGITIPDGASGSVNGTNTGDVTLAGTPNYLTIAGQAITRALIDLTSHITGRLPYANLTAAAAASRLLGRGSGSAGDWQEVALGSGLSMSGTTLSATGGGGAVALDDLTDVVITSPATDHIIKYSGTEWVNSATLPNHSATLLTSGIIPDARMPDLTGDVTTTEGAVATTIANDAVTYAKMQNVSAASRLIGRGDSGSGDPQEITLGSGLAMTGTTLSSSGGSTGVRTLTFIIDGGGSAITTGAKNGFARVPITGNITRATLLSTDASVTSGSIVIDVWKDTYANYPPTNADSITASAPPTLSSAIKSDDSTLTGWTTSVTVGDIIGITVDSVSTVTHVTLFLEITP